MYELTQRVKVKDPDSGEEFELPVGRIRDEDAVRYGLVDAPEPEKAEEPKKAAKKAKD